MNFNFTRNDLAAKSSRELVHLFKLAALAVGHPHELTPPFAKNNPEQRMRAAAKQLVRYDHLKRVNKIRKVGERMIGKDRGLER